MNKIRKRLRLGITMGDIGGIGPELVIRAFQDARLREMATPIVYGSTRVINIFRKVLEVEKFSYNVIERPDQAQNNKVSIIDVISDMERVDIGKASKQGGTVAVKALQRAVADMKEGTIDVMITLPIDKASIQGEEFNFPGHTEFLARSFDSEESLMFMVSEDLKVGVVTGHVPLKDVVSGISSEGILKKIKMMNKSLKEDFSITRPKIAVLGVNPHAGDNGLLGKEDKEKIRRAIDKATNEKILAVGPFPADGFFAAGTYRNFDGVLAMYHDQGLIPFKIIAGYRGVNYTAGLPIIRTSPDHGVAYDLAGKSTATTESFQQAIYLALDIYRNRLENQAIVAGAMSKKDSKQLIKELKKEKEAHSKARRAQEREEERNRPKPEEGAGDERKPRDPKRQPKGRDQRGKQKEGGKPAKPEAEPKAEQGKPEPKTEQAKPEPTAEQGKPETKPEQGKPEPKPKAAEKQPEPKVEAAPVAPKVETPKKEEPAPEPVAEKKAPEKAPQEVAAEVAKEEE